LSRNGVTESAAAAQQIAANTASKGEKFTAATTATDSANTTSSEFTDGALGIIDVGSALLRLGPPALRCKSAAGLCLTVHPLVNATSARARERGVLMDPADASPLEALEAELRASQAECRALKRTADELRVQHFEAFADLNAQLEKAHAELDRTRQLLVIEQRQTRLVEDEAKHAAEQYRQWAEESNAGAKETEQLLQAMRADLAHKTTLLSAARAVVRLPLFEPPGRKQS